MTGVHIEIELGRGGRGQAPHTARAQPQVRYNSILVRWHGDFFKKYNSFKILLYLLKVKNIPFKNKITYFLLKKLTIPPTQTHPTTQMHTPRGLYLQQLLSLYFFVCFGLIAK